MTGRRCHATTRCTPPSSAAESGRFYWLTYRNTCPRFVELPRLLEHNRVLQFPLETAPEFRDVTEYAE